MKVLMVGEFPRSQADIRGGTWAASHNLVEALIKHTDASVATITFRMDIDAEEQLERHGGRLQIWQFPLGRYRGLINHAGQRLAFSRIVRSWKPDLVHAQGEGLYASLAVNSGLPNVYTIHGVRLRELDMQRSELGFLRYHLRARAVRSHHRKATNIIVINKYTEHAIAGLHSAKIYEIPNAVRQDFFDIQAGGGRGEAHVLLVGGVRKRKDIRTAVNAIAALRERGHAVTLEIIGPNDDPQYLQDIESLLRTMNLRDAVKIRGLVDDEQLRGCYERADVLLLTSIEESSPVCIVEAMAAALPIVSTDVGGISEMVADNAILCEVGDAPALGTALETALFDQAAKTKMVEESRHIARSKWSAEAVARATHKAYQEIISV